MIKDKKKETFEEDFADFKLEAKPKIELSSSLPGKHKVKLIRDHTDNGKFFKKGETIEVDDSTLSFMVMHNIIEIKNRS